MKKAYIYGLLFVAHLLPALLHAEEQYDDSAINAATAAINAEASRVRAAAADARHQASQLRQTAVSVRGTANGARAKASAMRSQVSQVMANTAAANTAKQRSLSEQLSAQAEDARNRSDIERLKKNYEPLVQETYKDSGKDSFQILPDRPRRIDSQHIEQHAAEPHIFSLAKNSSFRPAQLAENRPLHCKGSTPRSRTGFWPACHFRLQTSADRGRIHGVPSPQGVHGDLVGFGCFPYHCPT